MLVDDDRDELAAHLVDDGTLAEDDAQTVDDLRFDVEKICRGCGYTQYLHVGLTAVNLAIQPSEEA